MENNLIKDVTIYVPFHKIPHMNSDADITHNPSIIIFIMRFVKLQI
jgi:hypothetical protein